MLIVSEKMAIILILLYVYYVYINIEFIYKCINSSLILSIK